jgi:Holliday junction resolvase-like predicted endonuclease
MLTIFSTYGWKYLTPLPLNNGLTYAIVYELLHEVDDSFYHNDTTGCLFDYLYEKDGIDKCLRTSFICPECLNRLSALKLDKKRMNIIEDVMSILDVLAAASKREMDVCDYWDKSVNKQPMSLIEPHDFIPKKVDNINVSREQISELCESYEELLDANINEKAEIKGAVFEGFAKNYFQLIEGWEIIEENCRLKECEIDLVIDIGKGPRFLSDKLGTYIYVECKNRKKKSDIHDISHCIENIRSRNLKAGIFFSFNGITGYKPEEWKKTDAAYSRIIDTYKMDEICLIPLVSQDVEIVRKGENLANLLSDIHSRFVRG